jgi:hypothetical protein
MPHLFRLVEVQTRLGLAMERRVRAVEKFQGCKDEIAISGVTLAVHKYLVDVAGFFVVRAVNVDADELRGAHQVRRHLGHRSRRPCGACRRNGNARGGFSTKSATGNQLHPFRVRGAGV